MKLKTSFCNGPVLRKNLGRFVPAWILYTICLLLGLTMLAGDSVEYWFSYNIAMGISFMGMVNCAYGALVALLLFGDLTNTRMCNGLHALPLRRETWFGTNVLSGLFFSFVPTAIMTVPAVILQSFSIVEKGWQIPLYWLLGTNLQFVFFFGLAVFCIMLSGSRIGAAVIYGILNFAAILAYYVAEIIYVPHLPGVIAQMEPFLAYCPVAMMVNISFVQTQQIQNFDAIRSDGPDKYLIGGTFTVTDNWWYLYVCAAVGIALLVLALFLYKKRKLECAGDMMATKKLEPVFLAVFALAAGSLLQLLYVAFRGYESYGATMFLWGGLVIGWFAGLMLLRKSSRVFRLKSFLGLALLAAALGASLLLNSMDVFGITRWVPKAEEVKSVQLGLSYMNSVVLEDPEDIADVIRLHKLGSEERLSGELGAINTAAELEGGDGTLIEIEYEMQDGSVHAREYLILIDSEAGDIARKHFSSIEAVFCGSYMNSASWMRNPETPGELRSAMEDADSIRIQGAELPAELLTQENIGALADAIIADSQEGNLVQHLAFHPEPVLVDENGYTLYGEYSMYLGFPDGGQLYLDVYTDSRHTLAWLEENGMLELFDVWMESKTY